MDYILRFFISVSQQVHANILVSSLPTCPGKKKSQWNSSFIHSSSTTVNTKKIEHPLRLVCLHVQGKKKFPSGTRVPLVWMLKKQSKQSAWNRAFTGWEKKNFPVELMFHRLEFHLEFQTLEFLSYIFFFKSHSFFIFLFFYILAFFLGISSFKHSSSSHVLFFLKISLFFFFFRYKLFS